MTGDPISSASWFAHPQLCFFLWVLLGIVIGINAAFIAICTEWLSDFKLGHCSYAWWLNQKFCCWGVESEGKRLGTRKMPSAQRQMNDSVDINIVGYPVIPIDYRWCVRRMDTVEQLWDHQLYLLPVLCRKDT